MAELERVRSSSPAPTSSDLTKLADYQRGRRLRGAREGARDGAGAGHRGAPRLGPARPRRRRLPDGPQGELPRRRAPASRPTSSSTRTSRSRARSRTARSCSRVPHRLIEGCLITAHAIGASDVFIYIRGEYLHRVRDPARRARGGARRRSCSAASRSSSTAAPAPTSAARRRRCSSRSRASAASRARSRRSRPSPGLYASPTPDQQRRDDRDRAEDHRARRAGVREDRRPTDSSGTRVFSLSGNVVNGGNYELPTRARRCAS